MILLQGASNIGDFLSGIVNDDSLVSGLIFSGTRGYIYGMVRNFGLDGFGNIQKLLLTVLTLYLTLWFILQGWRIATGRTQANMLQFSQRAVMAAFVMWLALLGANHSANIIDKIEDAQSIITATIAGENFKNPEKMLDGTLVLMQMMGNKLEAGLPKEADGKTMLTTGLLFVTGMGQALPAIISGGLLLLNRIALYLCIMFAPLCLAAYLFESTRFMFVTWAKFTVSTLFSMAVITVIVVMAIKAVLFVTAALMFAEMTGGIDLKSIATAQGGVGMLLTTLVLGGPPLVTNFFSGQVSAAVSAYNAVGGLTGSSGQGGASGSPEEMMKRAGGGGVAQNQQVQNIPNDAAGSEKLLGTNNQSTVAQNNDVVRTPEQAQRSVNRLDTGNTTAANNYSTSASSGGGGSAAAASYAATNAAEERVLAAQKTQPSTSTTAATANYAATNTPSSTASTGTTTGTATSSTGTTTASTGSNTSTVSNSTSSDSTVRLANKGIGDDSAAINQKYGSRGVNSPNRTV